MSYYDDDDIKEVYCTVHLNPRRNIFKRIISAVRYIFGHRSIYGEFDEFIFKPSDADRLQSVVDFLRSENDYMKERQSAPASREQYD